MSEVAWNLLCRLSVEEAAEVLAELSLVVDRYRTDPAVLTNLVGLMNAPSSIRGPLLAAARNGEPVFHPRAVQWILRELVAVEPGERALRSRWLPDGDDDASLLGRAWFRSLRSGRNPQPDEVLLAVWILHELFHGGNDSETSTDRLLGLVTSLGFQFHNAGKWLASLDRWLTIWTTPDDHPAVVGKPTTPSAVRCAYGEALGLPVEQWLAGVWGMCVRWWMAIDGTHAISGDANDIFGLPLDGGRVEFSDEFSRAFRTHCAATISELRAAVRIEGGDRYSGLASLHQGDSLSIRNHPVLQLSNGRLLPLSVELVAQRATALHRFILAGGSRGTLQSSVGPLFEAYVRDLLDRLALRHTVVHEDEITRTVGDVARCDAIVSYAGTYLAVEASIQVLSRRVARGDGEAMTTMAERYQAEADQALATLADLPEIISALGLPRAKQNTFLVVTDVPVPHSPPFLRQLQSLRADRTAKFVCGIDDFEFLVDLGVAGWSVPGAVEGWQARSDEAPFDVHLFGMSRIHGRPLGDSIASTERWLSLLPRREAPAA